MRSAQAVFLDNWIKATGGVLHGDDYFPDLPAAWQQRPLAEKFMEHAASLIGAQL